MKINKKFLIILSILYITYSAVDISPKYTTEQLEEKYGVEFDGYFYRRYHRFSLFTHKKIYYHLYNPCESEGIHWTYNIYIAEKENYFRSSEDKSFVEKEVRIIDSKEYEIRILFWNSRYSTECFVEKDNCIVRIDIWGPTTSSFKYNDAVFEIMYEVTEDVIRSVI